MALSHCCFFSLISEDMSFIVKGKSDSSSANGFYAFILKSGLPALSSCVALTWRRTLSPFLAGRKLHFTDKFNEKVNADHEAPLKGGQRVWSKLTGDCRTPSLKLLLWSKTVSSPKFQWTFFTFFKTELLLTVDFFQSLLKCLLDFYGVKKTLKSSCFLLNWTWS